MTAGLDPSRLLLATDFDGTLAEVVADPDRAAILPEAERALRQLNGALSLIAVISGRGTGDLSRRLPIRGLKLLGDYGLEDPSRSDLDAIAAFALEIVELTARPGIRMEVKPASISVHFRDAPAAGPALLEELKPLTERRRLQLRSGRLVAEIMPGSANKERALSKLIEEIRPGAVVWCGDDSGDRGCFELVGGLKIPHLAVGVDSPEAPPGLFDACDLLVTGPPGTAALLSGLAAWARPDRAGLGSGG